MICKQTERMRVSEIHLKLVSVSYGLLLRQFLQQFGFTGCLIFLFNIFIFQSAFSQQTDTSILFPTGRPEVYFRFFKPADISIRDISKIISVDSRRGDTLYA